MEQALSDSYQDVNRVEITGRIASPPELRVVPPGATFYISAYLTVRGIWPGYDGQATAIDYAIQCFAQGPTAERYLWLMTGDIVQIYGSLDLVVREWEESKLAPSYLQAVRISEMTLLHRRE